MHKTVRKVLRAVADYDPDYYDMYEDSNEALFARLYVERILEHANERGCGPPATLLEAGCQAGRLVVPFAKRGYRVTGIDTSGFALRRARRHAQATQVEAEFVEGDIVDVLARHPEWRYDVVVCAEVVYLARQYQQILQALAQAVRPGGLLCVSHRPKWYYVIEALRHSDVHTAMSVLERPEGPFRDSTYYNWQTEEELHALYASLGLRWLAMYPIDRCAWLTGLDPSRLPAEEREQLFVLERAQASPASLARYVLVIAQRPPAGQHA